MESSTKPTRKASKRSYGARPIKSRRRSKAEINRLKKAIYKIVEKYKPMTVRQVYYQLVSLGLIPKTEAQYKSTVCRLLADMRRDGTIPFWWIADSSRWMRKPTTYHGLEAMLEYSQDTYRRALWADQDAYVEIWLEKEALAGVLYEVTKEWDVPLMVTRGYPSLSYVFEAACTIKAQEKPCYLYYFGDRDPSGVDIDRFVEAQIREFGPGIDLTFTRVAVTKEQIEEFNLQTRPTKKSDSRSKGFDSESVEVDAINPDDLREICEDCITQHIDFEALRATYAVERAERDTLTTMIKGMGGAA